MPKYYIVIGRIFHKHKLLGLKIKDNSGSIKTISKQGIDKLFSRYTVLNCKYDKNGLHSIDGVYRVMDLPKYDLDGQLIYGNDQDYIENMVAYFNDKYNEEKKN